MAYLSRIFRESLETALNKPEHNIFRRYLLQARVNTLKNKFTTRFHLTLQLNVKLEDQGVNNHLTSFIYTLVREND